MQIEFLRTVIMVEKYCSFSEAADEIPCSQSSVSRQVKSVEDSLGIKIFDRKKSGSVVLTAEGASVMPYLAELEKTYEQLKSLCREKGEKTIDISLAINPMVFSTANKSLLCSSVYLLNPQLILEICEEYPSDLKQQLSSFQTDAGFFYIPYSTEKAETVPDFGSDIKLEELSRQNLNVCMSITHPLAAKDTVSFKELKNEIFIFNNNITVMHKSNDGSVHGYFIDECSRNGFYPGILRVDRNLADNKHALARHKRGIYPTFVPSFMHQDSELVYTPISDAHYYVKYYFAYSQRNIKSEYLNTLSNILKSLF